MPRRRLASGPRRPIRSAIVKRAGPGCHPSRRSSQTSSQVMNDTIVRPHVSVTNGTGAVKSYRLRLDGSRPEVWDGSIPNLDGRAFGAAPTSRNKRQSLKFSRPLPRPGSAEARLRQGEPKRRPKPRGGSARTGLRHAKAAPAAQAGQPTSRLNPSRPAGDAFFWSFLPQGQSVSVGDGPRTPRSRGKADASMKVGRRPPSGGTGRRTLQSKTLTGSSTI